MTEDGSQAELARLRQQIGVMEEEFGRHRAQFKDMFVTKENELCAERDKSDALRCQLDEALGRLAATEVSCQEELAAATRRHSEEMASIHYLQKEKIASYEYELEQLRQQLQQLQQHQQQLQQQQHQQQQLQQNHHHHQQQQQQQQRFSPHVLTSVTRQLAKRIAGSMAPAGGDTTAPTTSPVPVPAPGADDDSFREAALDSDGLRALIAALEQEIAALKDKLRTTDAQLQLQHSCRHQLQLADQLLARVSADTTLEQLSQQLRVACEAAAAAPTTTTTTVADTTSSSSSSGSGSGSGSGRLSSDTMVQLLLYTSLLEAQKHALSDDLRSIKESHDSVWRQLSEERHSLADTRQLFRATCDQLLETQRHHLAQTRRLRRALPADLLPLLEAPSPPQQQLQQQQQLVASSAPLACELETHDNHSTSSSRLSLATVDQSDGAQHLTGEAAAAADGAAAGAGAAAAAADGASGGGSCLSLMHDTGTVSVASLSSPSSLLSAGTDLARPPATDTLSVRSLNVQPGNERGRVVSEKEWKMLWDELTLTKRCTGECDNCSSLEKQLRHSVAAAAAAEKRLQQLQLVQQRLQRELDRELQFRRSSEALWKEKSERADQLIQQLSSSLSATELRCDQLHQQHSAFVATVQHRLRRLIADRHSVQKHLTSVETENEMLLGKHAATSAQLQDEFIDLPNTVEELQELLLRYRVDLISAKMARELADERLCAQQLVAGEACQALVHEKDVANRQLSGEIKTLRNQLESLESVQQQLHNEQLLRQTAEKQLLCARDTTQQLQQQLSTEMADKVALREQVAALKSRVSTMQLDLDNSEAVQRDFVKLSQSLQVELEKIRESETEVRWQHEEDVHVCIRCQNRFTVTRRKHHCRHCGKIYCIDCLARTVTCGASRTPSRVCDVCYTLLNRHSAPYFSLSAPSQPK